MANKQDNEKGGKRILHDRVVHNKGSAGLKLLPGKPPFYSNCAIEYIDTMWAHIHPLPHIPPW